MANPRKNIQRKKRITKRIRNRMIKNINAYNPATATEEETKQYRGRIAYLKG